MTCTVVSSFKNSSGWVNTSCNCTSATICCKLLTVIIEKLYCPIGYKICKFFISSISKGSSTSTSVEITISTIMIDIYILTSSRKRWLLSGPLKSPPIWTSPVGSTSPVTVIPELLVSSFLLPLWYRSTAPFIVENIAFSSELSECLWLNSICDPLCKYNVPPLVTVLTIPFVPSWKICKSSLLPNFNDFESGK